MFQETKSNCKLYRLEDDKMVVYGFAKAGKRFIPKEITQLGNKFFYTMPMPEGISEKIFVDTDDVEPVQ